MKKVIAKILIFIMNKKGYSSYFALDLVKEIFNDLFKNKQNTLKEKIWAYKRGFLSPKIKKNGLTDDNYKLYISDFDYYKLFPINGSFGKWINDKLTTKYILYPFNEYLPKYYCHIKNKETIIPLVDGNYIKNITDIVDLLKKEKDLALKLIAGSHGVGFYKLSYINNNFFINNKNVNENDFIEFLSRLENYILTEYITAHSDIRKVYSHSVNALRVMLINEDGKKPIVANAYMRFGTKDSGLIDHAYAGGIFSIVDVKSGRYYDGKRDEKYNLSNCEIHPDTKEKVEGYLPNWELIKTKLIEISKYLNEVIYMGFDIAITDDGFKVLEINSHQSITNYQYFYPLLFNNEATAFFKGLLSKKVR